MNPSPELFDKIVTVDLNELETPFRITFINFSSYLELRLADVSHFTHIGSDGALLTKILRAAAGTSSGLMRTSFDATSIGLEFFASNRWNFNTVVTVGGTSEEARVFSEKLDKVRANDIKIISLTGFLDEAGFPSWHHYMEAVISEYSPDAIIIGLGHPLQDTVSKLIFEISTEVSTITCGAFISQTAFSSSLNYYPDVINKYNLRWIWRFVKEPHVRRRILKKFPLAVIRSLFDVITSYGR